MRKKEQTEDIRTRCTPELKAAVVDLAQSKKIEESKIVRWAVEEYLERHPLPPNFVRDPKGQAAEVLARAAELARKSIARSRQKRQ